MEVSGGNVSSSQPSLTITFRIPKATFQAAGLNYLQALTLNICLGAQRYDGFTDPSHAWTTQSGVQATYDPGTGFYWGIVGDWPVLADPNPNPHITASRRPQHRQRCDRDVQAVPVGRLGLCLA